MSRTRTEYGRHQICFDTERDTAWLVLENVNRDAEHWLTIASPTGGAPIGYLRLRPIATAPHTFEIAEVRPATGPLLRLPDGSSSPEVPAQARIE